MSVADVPDILLTARELANRWSMTVGAISSLRRRGGGPEFFRLSEKVIRYKLGSVIEFEHRAKGLVADPAVVERQRASMAKARKALKALKLRQAKRRAAR